MNETPENMYIHRLGRSGLVFFPTDVLEESGLESRMIVPEMRAVRVVTDPNQPIKDSYLLNGRRVDADEVLGYMEEIDANCPHLR